MTSKINLHSSNIDAAFPVAGINQSSQGFRSNFDSIKKALTEANTEVTNLQNKTVKLAGDIAGTSPIFGEDAAPATIVTTLATVLSSPGAYNTATHDINVTFDAKGRATVASATAITNNVNTSTVYAINQNAMGTGSGSASFPTFKFDSLGRLQTVGSKTVTFGLLNQVLGKGRILAGGTGNVSNEIPAPAAYDGTYALMATGAGNTGLSWVKLDFPEGTVVGVTGGPGVNVQDNSINPIIKLDLSTLPTAALVADDDVMAFHSTAGAESRQITLANLKTVLSTSFLQNLVDDEAPVLGGNLDVADKQITSTHANGVVIQSDNGVTIGTSKWPTGNGNAGQILTTDGSGQLFWLGSALSALPRTMFVASAALGGDDTNGTGGLGTPYATIAKAMQSIPATTDLWTIMVLGGTFDENISIQTPANINIEGFFSHNKPVFTGQTSLLAGSGDVGFVNITFDSTARPVTDTAPIIDATFDIDSLTIRNCDLLRGDGELSDLPVIVMNGTLADKVVIDDCLIKGTIVNALAGDGDHRVTISNIRQTGDGQLSVEVSGTSNTRITNVPRIKGIKHNGGTLELEDITAILAKSYSITMPSPPTWQVDVNNDPILAPGPIDLGYMTPVLDANGRPIQETDGSDNPVFEADGITPVYKMTQFQQAYTENDGTVVTKDVGVYSSANAGLLSLRNVNLSYNDTYAAIVKTGTANWYFENVSRRADKDFIKGKRVTLDTNADSGEFIPHYRADGNSLTYADGSGAVSENKIDPKLGRAFQVELLNDSSIVLKTPEATAFALGSDSGEQIASIQIVVKQNTTGGYGVTFGADAGPGITWQSPTQPIQAANSLTLYTFHYFSTTRRWVASKALTTFSLGDLTDVPDSLAGSANHALKVNSGENAVEFVPPGQITIATDPGISRTLALVDAGKHVRFIGDSNIILTVPLNSNVAFPIGSTVSIAQAGAGQITIEGEVGVTIDYMAGLTNKTADRHTVVQLIKYDADKWTLFGGLAAAP